MNLVESYVEKIISERDITNEIRCYFKQKGIIYDNKLKYIELKMVVNCYGIVKEVKKIVNEEECNSIKALGYYLD